MSELFKAVSAFYGGDSLLKGSFVDLSFLVSDIGRSLISGNTIALKRSDKFMTVRKQAKQISRLDTIICLARISAVLETKLKTLPPEELRHLELMQQMSIKSAELTDSTTEV